MRKAVAIGDVHGYDTWAVAVNNEPDAEMYVFVGDYFDSINISRLQQIENFRNILAFKVANPGRVVMLLGNHDYHYLSCCKQRYTGYNVGFSVPIGAMLDDAIRDGHIKMCYSEDGYMFSHAGITKTWCVDNDVDTNNLAESVNDLFKYRPYKFEFVSGGDNKGDDVYQSPIWVRPNSLVSDAVDGYLHVVGHTTCDDIYIRENMILIDTLHVGQYLVIEDGTAITKHIK